MTVSAPVVCQVEAVVLEGTLELEKAYDEAIAEIPAKKTLTFFLVIIVINLYDEYVKCEQVEF